MNKHTTMFSSIFLGLSAFPANASDSVLLAHYASPLIIGLLLSALFAIRQLQLSSTVRNIVLISAALGSVIQVLAVELAYNYQQAFILFGSTIVWLSLYLSDRLYTLVPRQSQWQDKLVAIVTAAFFIALLVLPAINGYLIWVGFSVFILMMNIFSLRPKAKSVPLQKHSELVILVSFALYTLCGYLWLNALLANTAFIMVILLTYVVFLFGKLDELITLKQQRQSAANKAEPKTTNSFLDPITNLPNYQHAIQKLKLLDHQMVDDQYVAIVFKPVNFQEVNRVLGHQTSDILLLQLAYSLQKAVSDRRQLVNFNDSNDAVRIARLPGLEFLVVIDTSHIEHSTYIEVEDTCRALTNAVPKALSFKSFSLNFDLAFGVAVSEKQISDVELLIKYANDALLTAEQPSKSLVYFDHKTTLFAELQLQNMEKLKIDIANNRLEWLVFPQVSLQNHQLLGLKVECEWRGLNGDVLDKQLFREVAEYSGEIYQLTKITIKKAFDVLYYLHQRNLKCQVAIELASVELLQPELIDYINSIARNVGVATKYLMLDIDESLLLSASERTKAFIDQMTTGDVAIAINNFSGSYEALRYLRRSVVGQVKIDCNNLNQHQSETDKVIINALINLIRKMDMPLLASHIDTRDAHDAYLAIGGNFAQGRFIHKRLPLDQYQAWLKDWVTKYPVNEGKV